MSPVSKTPKSNRQTIHRPSVELKHGDLLSDVRSKLIVLPCSAQNTLGPSFEKYIVQNDLPRPGRLPFGTVSQIMVRPPQAFVFAASVSNDRSDTDAIAAIGVSLGKIAALSECKRIATPLLGAGNAANGTPRVASEEAFRALKKGFLEAAPPGAVLVVLIDELERFRKLELLNPPSLESKSAVQLGAMFLRSLELENVRSIKHLKLDFRQQGEPELSSLADVRQSAKSRTPKASLSGGRQWTLLIGENGTGKSTILRALGLAFAGSDALGDILGVPASWVRNGANEARIGITFADVTGAERHATLTIRRDDVLLSMMERNGPTLEVIDSMLGHARSNALVVGYGASRRLGGEASLRSARRFRSPRADSVGTLFANDAALIPLESWALSLDYRNPRKGFAAVQNALERLLPDVKFVMIEKKQGRLLFQTSDGVVPLEELSDGYQNMAAWCGDLMSRIAESFPQHANPFEAPVLLLVDEIDLHLHPVWQRGLRRFLSENFPRMQFVATTHSALTAQQSRAGELWGLERQNGGTTVRPFQGTPRFLMFHQMLLDPMFGVQTLDSYAVREMKDEYDRLSKKKPLTAGEKNVRKLLARRLSDLPEFGMRTPTDERREAIQERVSKELDRLARQGRSGAKPVARPARRKATVPAKKVSKRSATTSASRAKRRR